MTTHHQLNEFYAKHQCELSSEAQRELLDILRSLNPDVNPPLMQVDPETYVYSVGGSIQQVIPLRDRFAMAALQGCLANPNSGVDDNPQTFLAKVGRAAYIYADAMLAARKSES